MVGRSRGSLIHGFGQFPFSNRESADGNRPICIQVLNLPRDQYRGCISLAAFRTDRRRDQSASRRLVALNRSGVLNLQSRVLSEKNPAELFLHVRKLKS